MPWREAGKTAVVGFLATVALLLLVPVVIPILVILAWALSVTVSPWVYLLPAVLTPVIGGALATYSHRGSAAVGVAVGGVGAGLAVGGVGVLVGVFLAVLGLGFTPGEYQVDAGQYFVVFVGYGLGIGVAVGSLLGAVGGVTGQYARAR